MQQQIPALAQAASTNIDFSWVDWLIIGLYLAAIIAINLFFAYQRRKAKLNHSKSYFTGDGKAPSWVVGFSIWATILSVITYVATPANAYTYGWVYSFAQLTMFIFAPFLIKKIIPFFRLMKQTTAYSYLEARFSYAIRAINSFLFIFFNIFRVGIILYITTLAVAFIIPIDVWQTMLILGIFATISTLFGGMKGIVWVDATQGIIRILFVLIIIGYALANTDFADNFHLAPTFDKNSLNVHLVNIGIPLVFFSNIIITTYSYVGSQDTVRRYKAVDNPKKIHKSIWFVAILSLISIFLFYGLGSSLYSFYGGVKPTEISAQIIANNQLIPYFAYTVLPKGLGALLIASILSTGQANISSGITAIINSFMTDFLNVKYQKIKPKSQMLISQILIIILGIASTLLGIGILFLKTDDIIVYFLGVMSLFGSVPVAIFFLAMFSKRASFKSVLIGTILGLITALSLWFISQKLFLETPLLNNLWVSIFAFAVTVFFGYIFSFIFPNQKDITNLSWPTATPEFKEFAKLEKILFSNKKPANFADLEKRYAELKIILNV
ncbi:sodium:solute symporter family transporter [Candidatus Mycoplasma pogonae]